VAIIGILGGLWCDLVPDGIFMLKVCVVTSSIVWRRDSEESIRETNNLGAGFEKKPMNVAETMPSKLSQYAQG
jgi:hypothetical protein